MSVNVDPSAWRLQTSGGIPYKFVEMDGAFAEEDANVNWKAYIRATDLLAFMAELFPPPLVLGGQAIPRAASMPGAPGLKAKRVSFRTQTEGLPIDPFLADPSATAGTYHNFIEVSVEFGTGYKKPDEEDPFLFLEISSNTTGEFLHTSVPGAKWKPTRNPEADNTVNEADAGWADPETGEVTYGSISADGLEEDSEEINKDPTVPVIIPVPQTEWTVKWTQIPFDLFRSTIIHRLRLLIARVNSQPFQLLFNAPPETIHFVGYNYGVKYTWRDDEVETPPIQLELKFLEKRLFWKGVLIGHNHFWRPGHGWQRLLIDGVNSTFGAWDLNLMFKR